MKFHPTWYRTNSLQLLLVRFVPASTCLRNFRRSDERRDRRWIIGDETVPLLYNFLRDTTSSCFVWSFPAPSLSFTIIIHNNKFMLASACTK